MHLILEIRELISMTPSTISSRSTLKLIKTFKRFNANQITQDQTRLKIIYFIKNIIYRIFNLMQSLSPYIF